MHVPQLQSFHRLYCLLALCLTLVACGAHKQQEVNQAYYSKGGSPVNFVVQQAPRRDRSEYPAYTANPVKQTLEHPVSTFSVDVDTSSYSILRSHLKRGVMPPVEAIRTEELLNYFSYDYGLPQESDEPFLPQITVLDSPWSEDKQLVHIGIKGYDIERQEQPDSNLVFLLDVSGSMMAENKLPLAKRSIKLLLKSLKPTDTISLVVYAGSTGVVLKPTKVKHKAKIINALGSLRAGGGTAGAAGLALAYEQAMQNFQEDAVNRIFLATDGDFNIGAHSNDELQAMVEKYRDEGIYLSVLGFGGYNYQDDMMQAIAQHGNGIAAYIDTLQEAKKVLVDEATSSLFPIANDVKIQIEFNPATVAEYRLLGYETRQLAREDFNNDKVDAGEVGAGHSVTAIYEISPTSSSKQSVDPLRYQQPVADKPESLTNNNFADELGFLKIRYKLPGSETSRLISTPIAAQTQTDNEATFASAVALYAELIKNSVYIQNANLDDVVTMAKETKGRDEYGYRAEFIQLVELSRHLN
ncbi:MAG: von Willebrand factor type A domain-containing protein [Pseudomonadota bacterium]